MANIYLRVPEYVAAFYRNRDEKHPLERMQPVVFNCYTFEYRLLQIGSIPDKPTGPRTVMCLSQQSWSNILRGKLPYGGKVIIRRQPDDWPTPTEIATLEGRSLKRNEEKFDYICIQLPLEVMIGGVVFRTDKTFALTSKVAQQLSNVMRDEFYHYFSEWMIQEYRLFKSRGVTISKSEMMERFFAQYDIPMRNDFNSGNTMRMMMKRLSWKANESSSTERTPIEGEYFEYFTDEQLSKKTKTRKQK